MEDGMQVVRLLCCIAFVFCQSAFAQFIDGNELIKWVASSDRVQKRSYSEEDFFNHNQLMGYSQGAYDANRQFFCTPEQFTTRQLMGVIKKYIQDHPEQWNLAGDKLVVLAISKAFPCPTSKR